MQECFNSIYQFCTTNLPDKEIWPGFYKRRYNDFVKYYRLFPEETFHSVLEIGCGIGYQSSLLACISEKVVASDVDFGNMEKHSQGLQKTRDFIQAIGKKNIEVVEANAQHLPFANEAFDFVYCSYSFQYIPDKAKALAEVNRVLKKGGYFFCALPTAADRIDAAFQFYKEAFKKVLSCSFRKNDVAATPVVAVNATAQATPRTFKRFFPRVDDSDNKYFQEIFSRFPAKWKKLFFDNGCKIVRTYHTGFRLQEANRERLSQNVFKRFTDSVHSAGYIIIIQKKN